MYASLSSLVPNADDLLTLEVELRGWGRQAAW